MRKPTERITSAQNALLTRVRSLAERKYRREEGLFRFDGRKLFLEALAANVPLTAVLLCESAADGILAAAGEAELPQGCRAVLLPDALFARVSEEKSPDGVICVAKSLDKLHKTVTIDTRAAMEACPADAPVLLLESVRDPGNLGTVIRSAAAFGAGAVVLSADCADLYHPRAIRAAMGTLFTQPVLITEDLVGAVRVLAEHRRVFAAALDKNALRLGEARVSPNDAVLVGNEGHGLSQEAVAACTNTLYIPMREGVESLNAGVAASVLLWELTRGGRPC